MNAAPRPNSDASDALPLAELAAAAHVFLDGIGVTNAEGVFVYANPAHAAFFGFTRPREMIGLGWWTLYEADEQARLSELALPAIAETGGWRGAAVAKRRDGSLFHQELTLTRLADGGTLCTCRDVSERIAMQAEAQRLHDMRVRAEAASAAKSDLLAQVSHEVRTPLNAVMGLASVLARGGLSGEQREIVSLIEASSAAMERLLSDLLDVSKIEAGKFLLGAAPFDLCAAMEAVLSLARVNADEKGLACFFECGSGARGLFMGDEFRIRQLVLNLLSNAVKFTPRGEVRLSVDAHDYPDGCEVVIVVRDTGVGFPVDDAERLFRRFEQGADAAGGVGLGLSICSTLAEAMGGHIDVKAQPGAGSAFTLRLSLTRADALVTAADEPAEATEADLRILVAEDHAANRKVCELILESVGADLTFVSNGRDAVAARRAGAFHLILMDMAMPGMDGLEAVRAIRAYETATGSSRTPIAILSAHAREDQRVLAMNAGADHYITKPMTAASLLEGVERAIAAGQRKGVG